MGYEATIDLIRENWNNLTQEINDYCNEKGLNIPNILAVSKTRSIEEVNAAWDCGIRKFGENYVQELVSKADQLPQAEWHYIGHLQRGNAKKIVPFAKYIHSLDSVKLANRLANLKFQGKCLVQINISHEETKSGISYNYESIDKLLFQANTLGINIVGFMGMGAFSWTKTEIERNYHNFILFTKKYNLAEISLGMSHDWQEALDAGSTILRIGTKIFGSRN